MLAQPPFWFIALAFIAAIGPLVFIHELGHYLVARWCGVGAETFSIGFGREIAGWTDKRGTRWKIGWLPLGGYVRFVGDMNPASQPGDQEVLAPADRKRAFHLKPVWQRFLIVLAGPLANFLLAVAIFIFFFAVFGMPRTPAVVAQIQPASANRRGFKPVSLEGKASVTLESTIVEKSSRNVVARVRGTQRPDEAVVYLAHWDHLGKHPDEAGDNIYNGAIDNATGVAGIMEIAEAFAKAPPKRSVLFLAVTLEESGLLGSKYYVAHPAVPLANTVGVINIDAMSTYGKAKDIVVTGLGNSELDDVLRTIADKQGRVLREEATPESGFYFRSDHFNFAKAGVPALYAEGGEDLVEGGSAAGRKAAEAYTQARYHKPDDEYDADWNLEGTMQDLETLYAVGRTLADGDTWPNWRTGNPFRAARDASRPPAAK